MPQALPTRLQKVPLSSGAQPQRLAVPPPPHVSGLAQAPQSVVRTTPQLS
ncbi:MAG: hypothetical protein AB1938_05100 [Myxococcota bacterium]